MIAQSEIKPDVPLPLPPGMITMWYGDPATPPTGWAVCDGTNGTPDLRGRVPVGLKSTDADFDTKGETGGAKTVALAEAELPTHHHSSPVHTHPAGDLKCPEYDNWTAAGAYGAMGGNDTSKNRDISITGNTGNNAAANTGDIGSGTGHNNLPPYLVLTFIMKL